MSSNLVNFNWYPRLLFTSPFTFLVFCYFSWSDAVLWNPHLQMEACYRDFVCVENAKVINFQVSSILVSKNNAGFFLCQLDSRLQIMCQLYIML